MPVYRVIINNKDTHEYITASNPQDAYFDVAAAMPLTYADNIQLKEVADEAAPGLPLGNNTVQNSTVSTLEQELYIDKPE